MEDYFVTVTYFKRTDFYMGKINYVYYFISK